MLGNQTSTEVVVRQLGQIDLEPLLSLYGHLHQNDDPLPDAGRLQQLWSSIVGDPSQIYLGGFVDDLLVAACNAAVIPNLTRGARPYAVIENVVTHAQHRRQGIGSKVLRELLERCWQRHCYKVMLMSAVGRAEIHGFYESLGFASDSKRAFVMVAR